MSIYDPLLDPVLAVATDQPDYSPDATAEITATNVTAGGTVVFDVTHVDDPLAPIGVTEWSVTDGGPGDADGEVNGVIKTSWYVDPAALGQSFELVATDLTSGATATVDYTDSTHAPVAASPTIQNQTLFVTGNLDSATGTGIFPSFVQIQNKGTEEGFNTDYRPAVEDTDNSLVHNHSIQLKDIPTTTIDGVVYREFRLDLNESQDSITLDSLQIYKASVGNLSSLSGAAQLYDMDGGADGKTGGGDDADVSVQLNSWATGSGHSDYLVYIRDSFFTGTGSNDYIYLYSKFSNADAGFEEWSVAPTAPPPEQPTAKLSIQKVTVDGGAEGDGLSVLAGDTITWKYTVQNVGTGSVANVSVTDDHSGISPTYLSGDTNNNNLLDAGESWIFTATGAAIAGAYSNIGTAHGDGPVNGVTTALTDSDPSSYFGLDPSISLVKETVDGSAHGDGLNILTGETISWSYHVVNTGNVALTNISVVDDNGTATTTDDIVVGTIASLAAGASTDLTLLGVAGIGAYGNSATVTTNDVVDDAGHHATVTNSDGSNYFGLNPHITLDKKTNGIDHGLNVFAGTTVNWTYDVLNDGNVALNHVIVRDDNGTSGTTSDDFNAAQILSGGFNTGDSNQNGILDIGETWHFKASGVASVGNYTNSATATTDPISDTAGHSRTPASTDTSDYEGYSNKALTQGFWGSHTDAWDGVIGSVSNATKGAVSSGVLFSSEINPTTKPGYLLLGDSDGDGLADDAHNLWISISLAQSIESASTTGDARLIMLQQAIATQLNIDNHVAQPNNLIDEAVMWLTGKGSWAGLGVNVDSNSDGFVDQTVSGSKYSLTGSAVATSTTAWQKYVDVINNPAVPGWDKDANPLNGNQQVDGEGLKNALMWFNQDQLVTSGSGAGSHVAWFDGTNIVHENPNALDDFWLTLHQTTNLTGIG